MPARGPRALAANLALSLGVTLVCLGLLEGLARFFERRAPERPEPEAEYLRGWGEWKDDFYQFGRSAPGWPPEQPTNRDGLRDGHHALDAPPGHERLLVLGDSVAYGLKLDARNAFPQALQRLLDERGARLEVFNAGVPGFTTRQQRIAYERLLRPYGARQALLALCLNDPLELQLNLARPPRWLVAWHARSALVRRLVNASGRELESVYALNLDPDAARGREALRRFKDELGALRDELRRDGVSLSLAILPYRFQVAPGAPPPALQARLLALAGELGLEAQDLLTSLLPLGEAAFLDQNHLSVKGSAAVAAALAQGPLLKLGVGHAERLAARTRTLDRAVLTGFLQSPEAELRAASAWGLQRVELDEAAALALARVAREDQDGDARFEALRALGRAPGLAEVRAALHAALTSPSECQRLEAARGLWALEPERGDAPRLAAAFVADDAYVRAFAEEALARLGAGSLPAVEPLLAHADGDVRRRAVRRVGRLGPAAQAAQALVARLGDVDATVRRQAARVLGRLGPAARAARVALERAAREDQDAQVRAEAERALARVQASASNVT